MPDHQVLYAEDEYINRKLVEIHLNKAGISCQLASDGLEAWHLVQKNRYEVIILDRYMPGMNGDELARKILEINPDQPLIAITSDDSEIDNLKTIGFRHVFVKPLVESEYIECICSYLNN